MQFALHPAVVSIANHPFQQGTYICLSNEDHGRHVCDNRLSCPITCELCSRLCSMGDHFHGMGGDSLHLCGYVVSFISHRLSTRYLTFMQGKPILVVISAPLPGFAR